MDFDPATAKGRTIVTMHDDAWLRFGDAQSFGWASNDTIYYLSEATGFMHLYEVPFSGGAPKQLTSGKWEVDSAVLSDDKKSFYLTTSEESPFVRHLYRIPVAGGASTKLTSMDGDNEAVVSPDGSAIANVYSYTNKPPELYVSGEARHDVARTRVCELSVARRSHRPRARARRRRGSGAHLQAGQLERADPR